MSGYLDSLINRHFSPEYLVLPQARSRFEGEHGLQEMDSEQVVEDFQKDTVPGEVVHRRATMDKPSVEGERESKKPGHRSVDPQFQEETAARKPTPSFAEMKDTGVPEMAPGRKSVDNQDVQSPSMGDEFRWRETAPPERVTGDNLLTVNPPGQPGPKKSAPFDAPDIEFPEPANMPVGIPGNEVVRARDGDSGTMTRPASAEQVHQEHLHPDRFTREVIRGGTNTESGHVTRPGILQVPPRAIDQDPPPGLAAEARMKNEKPVQPVKVTIGRIEVRVVMPQAPPRVARPDAPKPKISLDEYLNNRKRDER